MLAKRRATFLIFTKFIAEVHASARPIRWDPEEEMWKRTGEYRSGRPAASGWALDSFPYGFLVGAPLATEGGWEWRSLRPLPGPPQRPGPGSIPGRHFSPRSPGGGRSGDGDGIPNGEELYFGTDPLTVNGERIFKPVLDAGAQQFRLEWQQASNTFGLTSKVAWTTNVASGPCSTNGLQVTNLGPAPTVGYRRYEARLAIVNGSNVLLRVIVD